MENGKVVLIVIGTLLIGGIGGYYSARINQPLSKSYMKETGSMMQSNGSTMMQMGKMMMDGGGMMQQKGTNDADMMQKGKELEENGSMMREKGAEMSGRGNGMMDMMGS